ncbi:MAG: GTP-binding protein, partial [Chloroflexota bacterium]
MLATISQIWGLPVSTSSLITLVTGSLGSAVGIGMRRMLFGGLLEFVPGIGTAAGITINAATSIALTTLVGEAYITALHTYFKDAPDREVDIMAIRQLFEQELGKGKFMSGITEKGEPR